MTKQPIIRAFFDEPTDTVSYLVAVSEQCEKNSHVKKGVTEDGFVAMRSKRDATLSAPRLLLPSIQVNIRAGKFPPKETTACAIS